MADKIDKILSTGLFTPVYNNKIIKKLRKKYTYLDDKLVTYVKYNDYIRYIAYDDKKIFKFLPKLGEGADGEVYNAFEKLEKKKNMIEMNSKTSKIITIKIVPIKQNNISEELILLKKVRDYLDKTDNNVFPYLITNCICHNMYPEYFTNTLIKQNFYKSDFIEQLQDYLKNNKKDHININEFSKYLKYIKYTDITHIYVMSYIGPSLKGWMDIYDTNKIGITLIQFNTICMVIYLLSEIDVYHLDLHLNNIIIDDAFKPLKMLNGKTIDMQYIVGYKIIDFSRGTYYGSTLFEKKIRNFYKKFFPDFYSKNKKKLIDAINNKINRLRFHSIDYWRFATSLKTYYQNRSFIYPQMIDIVIDIGEKDLLSEIFINKKISLVERFRPR